MKGRASTRVAWSLWALAMLLLAATLALVILNGGGKRIGGTVFTYVALTLVAVGYGTAGALIISRVRGNPIGWALTAMGLALLLSGFGEQYLLRALVTAPGSLPLTGVVEWMLAWVLTVAVAPIPIVFLLFPTGAVHSPRWRWVLRGSLAALAVGVVVQMILPSTVDGLTNALGDRGVHVLNPLGLSGAKGLLGSVLASAGAVGFAAAVLSIASLAWRVRRADREEREQIRWLAFVAVTLLVLIVVATVLPAFVGTDSLAQEVFFIAMTTFGFLGIPAAVTIAILRYRLYDIDVVINKTVVYGLLAGFITAVYVAIVVGLGAALGQGASKPNLGLSILATAVVAVAFQPVRDRIQRLANRLVYGRRATPYEILSEFSQRMGASYATEDVLPRMARILAEGTGAAEARVWLKVGDELRDAAGWPSEVALGHSLPLPADGDGEPDFSGATETLAVHHRGELLGALSLTKAPGDRLKPAEEHLARDLAAGAGLVLRNVGLTQELLVRLDQLQASRRRIVAAADEARRKLERDIHDGAQQQLVALAVQTRLAGNLMASDAGKGDELLARIEAGLGDALKDLGDLARGVYPPLLADRGLAAALEAQARKASLPVEVESDGLGRYPQDAEAAVYFCCLEALQNVAKYAGATRAVVRLWAPDGSLAFTVSDDGAGFDPSARRHGTGMQGMADRLSALGGELRVESAPGAGTTITGRIPVSALEAVR